MAFKVGEKVVYPNHGVGIIEGISNHSIQGSVSCFYTLRLTATNSTVMVPMSNAGEVGLRTPINAPECERLLKNLATNFSDPPTDWKNRYKDFLEKMRTGDVFSVAEVLKTLTYLNQLKPLSFREKRMLERARFLVVSELTIACKKPEKLVGPMVDEALGKACAKHTRRVERAALAAAG